MGYTFLVMIHTIFFDLDNTLYSRHSGIWEAIGNRISLFMTDVLSINEDDVMPLRRQFRENYGTTLMGLQSLFDVDEMEYLAYVHDVDLHAMLNDDGKLKELIKNIPQRKFIFTNSDSAHATRVLSLFNIQQYFERIIDVIAMKPYVKPHPQSYEIALGMSGIQSPDGCMFIDDMIENVKGASLAGFYSVFVGDAHPEFPTIKDIYELPSLLEKTIQENN